MYLFIFSFLVSTFIFCVVLLIKSEITLKNSTKILNAIDAYAEEHEDYETAMLLLLHIEDFEKSLFRMTDWGYKNMLPKEDFEIIKPYIR